MGRRWRVGLWGLVALLGMVAPSPAGTADVYQSSVIGLSHELARLSTTARVLHIGAHPDDEDTALLCALARGEGARVAYLSLNRGEGGQNGIGPELYDSLGIVRTEELLAARRLDGAEQYFTSVYDFGFTKTLDEAMARWGHDATLSDIVWVIRKFRPNVIIARFQGLPSDGHGQHQVAGRLSREAFRAAADPAMFPDQIQLGLPAWQAQRLYQDQFRSTDAGYRLAVGESSTLYGRSWLSIAMESRSLHRSQDMGRDQPLGAHTARLSLVDSTVPTDPDAGPLDGLPVALTALLPPAVEGEESAVAGLRTALAEAEAGVEQASTLLRSRGSQLQAIAGLSQALRNLRRASDAIDAGALPAKVEAASFRIALNQKLTEASEGLALAAGIQLDARSDRPSAVPGGTVRVATEVFWPEASPVTGARATLELPDGWGVTTGNDRIETGNSAPQWFAGYDVKIPADAVPDQPYWLRQPRVGDRFAAPEPALRGLPLAPPRMMCRLRCVVDGSVLQLLRPVTCQVVDPRRGESRHQVLIAPQVSADVEPGLVLLPGGAAKQVELDVTVRNHGREPVAGKLEVKLDDSVLVDQETGVGAGSRSLLRLPTPLPKLSQRANLTLTWTPIDGQPVALDTVHRIDYEHIQPHLYRTPATVGLVPLDVQADTGRKLGYIPGPGDDLPAALQRLGLSVKLLDDAALSEPDAFAGLDTIFVGIRAYEVNEALQRVNRRLLDWTKAGGTLVVQYQKYPFVDGHYEALPLTMVRPHDRIVDETAPVKFLAPDHPLLTTPNRLGPADFEGWVQERGLYFANTWDEAYTPLLGAADPGEAERDGGFLAADLGEGKYVYCAWALFRQLPAGVPGAYRMLANLAAY